jgi:hypothetical protein
MTRTRNRRSTAGETPAKKKPQEDPGEIKHQEKIEEAGTNREKPQKAATPTARTDLKTPKDVRDCATETDQGSDVVSLIVELKSMILVLSDRVKSLESQLKVSKQTSVATETVTVAVKSYADAATQPRHSTATPPVKKTPSTPVCSEPKRSESHDGMKKAEKAGKRIDVRDGRHSDVKEPEEAAPRVLVFHDSVLKGVEWDRLDLAYGLHSKAQKVYRAADISEALKLHKNTEQQPDCVLIHVGVNDINRVSDIKASSDIMAKAIKEVRGAMKTKVVVSLPAPVLPARLDAKREIYTALLKAELLGEKDVVTVHHNNLPRGKLQTDGIHPTRAGTSVLAATLGRFLHRLFWEKPRRRKAAYHQRPFHMSSTPRAGFYAGPPSRQMFPMPPPPLPRWAFQYPIPPFAQSRF